MSADLVESLGERFLHAVSAVDADAVLAMCAPDVVWWLNISETEENRDALVARIALERGHLSEVGVEDVRLKATSDGFVAQMTTVGRTSAGEAVRIPVCLVVEVAGGVISRVEEYASLHHAKPLLRAMAGDGG